MNNGLLGFLRSYRPVRALPDPSTLPFPGNLIRLCTDCGLHKTCKAPVPGHGTVPTRVMMIGQSPGWQEDQWGYEPFVGRAGEQLNSLLSQISLPRDFVYLDNVGHCHPLQDREYTKAETAACSKWLKLSLGIVNPEIVVAMGRPAINWFLGSDSGTVEHLHGKPIEKDGRIILPMYHPAAALRDTGLLRHLYDDFQVLRGLLAGHPITDYVVRDEYPNPDYRVADTPQLLKQVIAEVRSAGEFAIDVETTKRDTELWSVQVSTRPGSAWFIPARMFPQGRVGLRSWNAAAIVHHYLNDVKWLDIADGRFFDSMIAAYLCGQPQGLKELAYRLCGVKMVNYREVVSFAQRPLSLTYLQTATAREWAPPLGIEVSKWDNKKGKVVTRIRKPWHISRKVAKILKDVEEKPETDPWERWEKNIDATERSDVESVSGLMPEVSLADIPYEDAVRYSCRDSDSTLRVKLKLEKMLTDVGLDYVYWMDTGILPMVREMMDNGMAVDVDYYRTLSADYTVRLAEIAERAAAMVGHPFNPGSRPQVAAVVYGELGFKPTAFTDTGEISTDDMELKKVKHPVVKDIILYRRLNKLKGTYSDNTIRSARPDSHGTPRMHTVLTTTRVETGRLSSKKDDDGTGANLQNIPTRGKEGKAIKRGFVAAPEKRLVEIDYGQIEICTQAHLANCKGLIELFTKGLDPHTTTASRLFDVPYEEAKKDKYRYPCKRAGFGIIYLIGPRGLANQIQEYIADLEMEGEPIGVEPWTEDQCAHFIAEYYKLYPEIRDYQFEQASLARRKGYTVDMVGRRRFIPEINSSIQSIQEEGKRKAANFPVTSSAQSIIKSAMGRLWRDLPQMDDWRSRASWLLQIHDSLLVELNDDDAFVHDFLVWMRDVMTGVIKLRVPVKVDFKAGYRWSELEEVRL